MTAEFLDGQLTGKSVSYFRNGKRCLEWQNLNGVSHGKTNHYTPDGRLFGISQWVNGKQVDSKTLDDRVSLADVEAIKERNKFSGFLKDHWKEPRQAAAPVAQADMEAAEVEYLEAKGLYDADQRRYETQRNYSSQQAGRLAASGVRLPPVTPPDPALAQRLRFAEQRYLEAKRICEETK